MVEEERELPARTQHPCDLGDRTVDVVDVFEHQTRNDGIERGVGERELGCLRSCEHRSPTVFVRHRDLVPRRIDTDHTGPFGGEQPTDLAVTAAEVEDAIRAIELGGGQRQDLLDVLRVGALGESLDPPVGVRLPQVVITRFPEPGSRGTTVVPGDPGSGNHDRVGVAGHGGRGYGRRS